VTLPKLERGFDSLLPHHAEKREPPSERLHFPPWSLSTCSSSVMVFARFVANEKVGVRFSATALIVFSERACMRKSIVAAFVMFIVVFGGFFSPTDTLAASCGATTSFYRSGTNTIANATMWCSGKTGSGKVCITGNGYTSCSPSIYLPSSGASGSASTSRSWAGICLVNGGAKYYYAQAIVNGVVLSSKTIKVC
jgi:hypothetical protein